MLRHKGRKRTFKHNLKLAILLSATAGIVNVAGFISFAVYTTNVTGHVALFAKELSEGNFHLTKIIALWMLLFLMGAFFSNSVIHIMSKKAPRFSHTLPLLIEAIILLCVGYTSQNYKYSVERDHFLAGCLLFAMGMQNAMVSVVSGFVVRTTHLTGMFTDLGIELSKLFHTKRDDRKDLSKIIILHSSIIGMFIAGGVIGGILFQYIQHKIFVIAAFILIIALFYDSTQIVFYRIKRRLFK
jgi:uncharacterized membrane protein YoaK (UPF0700 family)